jgi:Mrp family chromosome partitioning ATPase
MDERSTPTVITAIADSDFEGFVASTLFSQGWSVAFRALNFESLVEYIKINECSKSILIYSPDLLGISQDALNSLKPFLQRILGFSPASGENNNLSEIFERPKGPLDLLEAIRGNIRSPMVHSPQTQKPKTKRAVVIAFGSLGNANGCTTVAMNCAFELAHLEKKVLLIDANSAAPAIAILSNQRNLNSSDSWKLIGQSIFGVEVTQKNIEGIQVDLTQAIQDFDYIIVDLGVMSELSNILIDRRWSSQIAIWCCNCADQLIVVTGPGILPELRLRKFILSLAKISISAQIGYVFNGRKKNKKGDLEEEMFLATVTPLRPACLYILPSDSRGVDQAQSEQKPLGEVNERGSLRKAIAHISSELVG